MNCYEKCDRFFFFFFLTELIELNSIDIYCDVIFLFIYLFFKENKAAGFHTASTISILPQVRPNSHG